MNENIIHVSAIKLRVTGRGNLIPTLFSQDFVINKTLVSIPISSSDGNEPIRLANFVSQKVMLRLEVKEQDENFRVNRILIYIKPVRTMNPG